MKPRILARHRILAAGIASLVGAAGAADSAFAGNRRAMVNTSAASSASGLDVHRVVRGRASFQFGNGLTTIRASDRAIIDYDSFNIPAGTTVRFIQPSSQAVVLNRIIGPDPSYIDGRLVSNGIVWIVNPAGVMFGQNSVINVGGIYAAAGKISNEDFRRGLARFHDVTGEVVNAGDINARSAAHLIGASVENIGSIVAANGVVTLSSGRDVFLSEHGAALMVRVDSPSASGGAESLDGVGVSNSGDVSGNDVLFTAGDLYSIAIKHDGVVRANGGSVTFQGDSTVVSTGDINVSDLRSGATGGSVRIVGRDISLEGGVIDASGDSGGGTVHVGGGVHGSGETASNTDVYAETTIHADAVTNGNGGEVVVWADGVAQYAGLITAEGGANGGDGGFIEVSGKEQLVFRGDVSTGASRGATGTLLLDPKNITVGNVGEDAGPDNTGFGDQADQDVTISATSVENLVENTNVVLQANTDITIGSTINTFGGAGTDGALTLQAGRNIIVRADIKTDGNLIFSANDPGAIPAQRTAGAGGIYIGYTDPTTPKKVDIIGKDITMTVHETNGASVAGGVFLGGDTMSTITGDSLVVVGPLGVSIEAGSIVAPTLSIHAGTSGVGDIVFGLSGVVIDSSNMTLWAGSGSGAHSASKVDFSSNAPILRGDGGNGTRPDMLTIRQDASINVSTDLLAAGQFQDALTGMNYILTSDGGSITIPADAAKVDGTNLTLNAANDVTTGVVLSLGGLSVNSGSANIAAGINGTTGGISIETDGALMVGATLDGGVTGVSLHSGASGIGDITFTAGGISLIGDAIALRAGDGAGSTAQVDFTANTPMIQGSAALTSPTTYTHRQDAAIPAGAILDATQFVDGIAGMQYTLQSDGGNLTISNASNLNGTDLSLGAGQTLTIDTALDVNSLTMAAATGGVSGDVIVNDTLTVTGGAVSSSGVNFDNSGGGAIDSASIQFDHTGNVNLVNNQNTMVVNSDIDGTATLDITGNLDMTNAGDLDLGLSNITGGLIAQSTNGAISLSGDVTVGGGVAFTANGANGGVSLTGDRLKSASPIQISTSGDATIEHMGSVTLAPTTVGGSLFVTQTGVGSVTSLGLVTVTDNATISSTGSGGPFDISFGDLQVGGSLLLSAPGNVAVTSSAAGGLDLGTSSVGGNLNLTTPNGQISDSGTLTMNNAASTLTLQADSVDLGSLDSVATLDLMTVNDAFIGNVKAITLTNPNVGGNLGLDTPETATISSTGTIDFGSVSVGDTFQVTAPDVNFNGGDSSVSAKNGGVDVVLLPDAAGTDIGVGAVTGGFDLSATDAAAFADGFNSITIGRADSSGALTVGTATFRDDVTLRAPGAGSVVTLNGTLATQTANADVTLLGSGPIAAQGSILTEGGAITILNPLNLAGGTTLDTTQNSAAGGNIMLGSVTASAANTTFTANAGSSGMYSSSAIGANGNLSDVFITGGTSVAITGNLSATNDVTLEGDSLSITGVLSTPGDVIVRAFSLGQDIGVGVASGGLELTGQTFDAIFGQASSGYSSLTIGRSDGTGTVTLGDGVAIDLYDNTSVLAGGVGGTILVDSVLRMNGLASLTLDATATTLNQDLSTDGGDLAIVGPATLTTNILLDANRDGLVNGGNVSVGAVSGTGAESITLATAGTGGASLTGDVTDVDSFKVDATATTLESDVTITAAGIEFTGTIDSDNPGTLRSLTLNAGDQGARLPGLIGSSIALDSMSITGEVVDLGGGVTTKNTQSWEAVTASGSTTLTSLDGDAITFNGDFTAADSVTVNGDATINGADVTAQTGSLAFMNDVTLGNASDVTLSSNTGTTVSGNVDGQGNLTVQGDARIDGATVDVASVDFNGSLDFTGASLSVTTTTTADFSTINGSGAGSTLTVNASDTTTGATFGGAITNLDTLVSTGESTIDTPILDVNRMQFGDDVHLTGSTELYAGVDATNGGVFLSGNVDGDSSVLLTVDGRVVTDAGAETIQVGAFATLAGGADDVLVIEGPGLVIEGENGVALDRVIGVGNPDFQIKSPVISLAGDVSGLDRFDLDPFTNGAAANTMLGAITVEANTIDIETTLQVDGGTAVLDAMNVFFARNVSGTGSLTVDGTTRISNSNMKFTLGTGLTFDGAVVSTLPGLASLTIDGAGTVSFSNDIGASGSFNEVNISSNARLNAADLQIVAGTVSLGQVDSAGAFETNLTINADTLSLNGEMGGIQTLGSLLANITGSTTVSAPITTTGDQTFTSPVTLGGTTIINAANAHFQSDVNGAHGLTVNADVVFDGTIGQSTPLASLTSTGLSTFNDALVTTTGAQSYTDVLLGSDGVFTGESIAFNSTIDSTDVDEDRDLFVDSGNGATVFGGNVTGIDELQTDAQGTTYIGADMEVGSVRFDDAVVLTNDVMIEAYGNEGIFFNNTINSDSGETPRSLTLLTDRHVIDRIAMTVGNMDTTISANEVDAFRDALFAYIVTNGNPLPVISFGGDVGTTNALDALRVNPDGVVTALNDGYRSSPAVAATIVGGQRDANGQLVGNTFDLDIVANSFEMGRNEKFTVFGSLNVNASGGITVGDIVTARNLTLDAGESAITFLYRNVGDLIAPATNPTDVFGLLVGSPPDVAEPLDIIAGGTITLTSGSLEADTAGVTSPLSIVFASAGLNSNNAVLSLPGNVIAKVFPSVPIPADQLLIVIDDPSTRGLNNGYQLVLDLPSDGLTPVDATGLDGITGFFQETGLGLIQDQVLVSRSVRERLERIGVNARDPNSDERAEAADGRTVYNDFASEMLASDNVGQYTGEIVVNRLPAAVANAIVDNFDAIVGENDEGLNLFLDNLATAYLDFQDTADDELFDDPRLLASAFAAQLPAMAGGSDLVVTINEIVRLLGDVRNLGMTEYEYLRAEETVLATFTPDPDMSLEEFRTVVEWYSERLTEPAPQEALNTTGTGNGARESG